MYKQSSLQNIKIQYYVVLKVCKNFFLTRLGFPKTPANPWKNTSNHRVATNSWLNL